MSARAWTYLAILLGLMFHGAVLPFTYGQTYDAYIHMFFGNHYLESWFDPWETRWYTGFTVTAYPPGSHQALGLLMRLVDMRAAYVILQLLAISMLITGVFRFSRIWVNDMAASYAALLCAFSTSISETLHIFGQLPTLLSISLFLNAIPHISGWIEYGRKSDFFLGLAFTAATTSVHHVTPLFGTVFFVAPVGVAALLGNLKRRMPEKPDGLIKAALWASPALIRGIAMGVCMLILIITIVFPYWHWSITDPITQVSIPHGSRENFLVKRNLGLIFFAIPWGLLIFVVPYVIMKLRTPLWPLGLSILLALLLGTGGTTPLPRILLGHAFDILTLDRFTFWASLLILPFAGLAVQSLWEGRGKILVERAYGTFLSRATLVLVLVSYVSLAIGTALLPTFRPMQPDFIDPGPLVKFMDEDRHSNWRYLTLGFGDQFAYHSALIDAESVDGNYHSARRLPSLMNYSIERLENSKYAGVPGLASLNQFLTNAEKFHLKYIFSNDEFYDPVLHYTGWNPITRLNNGIRVWEKPDISPLPNVRPRRDLPAYQKKMWGTLPISALTLGILTFLGLALTQKLISAPASPHLEEKKNLRMFLPNHSLIRFTRLLPIVASVILVFIVNSILSARDDIPPPETVLEKFYQHLDFRETYEAFELLQTHSDWDYGQFLKEQKLTGGLVPSYGKLTSVTSLDVQMQKSATAKVSYVLVYLTSVGIREVPSESTLIKNSEGHWKLQYKPLDKRFVPNLTTIENVEHFRDIAGQSLLKSTDLVQRLARPNIEVMGAEFIERDGRFYVAGRIKNISEFPACTKIMAKTISENDSITLEQHAGRIGAHRLLPGEDSAFRIDFEGYLKIQDQAFNAAYDPEQFSVPELEAAPSDIKLNLSTTVCAPAYYKSLSFGDIEFSDTPDGRYLTLNVTNTGTKIVSTMQMKLSYLAPQGDLKWVEPYYLQNNLVPGEERSINIPLSDRREIPISSVQTARVNGKDNAINRTANWPTTIKIPEKSDPITVNQGRLILSTTIEAPEKSGQIIIDYDAMIYRPLD